MARLWNLSRQRPHHHRRSCAGERRRDEASRDHRRTGSAGCIGQAGLIGRGRPDAPLGRRRHAAGAFADASDADLRKTILRRRGGHRRHPGRRRQVARASARRGSARSAGPLRHRHRRRGHHRKLGVRGVRRAESVPARDHQPQDFRRAAKGGIGTVADLIRSTLRNISFRQASSRRSSPRTLLSEAPRNRVEPTPWSQSDSLWPKDRRLRGI